MTFYSPAIFHCVLQFLFGLNNKQHGSGIQLKAFRTVRADQAMEATEDGGDRGGGTTITHIDRLC